MQLNPRESSFELEIQSLLVLHGSPAQAAAQLLKKYEDTPLNLEQAESIGAFCLAAGAQASLVNFFSKQISMDGAVPWGHFVEALALAQNKIDGSLAEVLLEAAGDQQMTWHLARSHVLDPYTDDLQRQRELRRRAQLEKALNTKRDLLLQVDTLRSQELDDEEGQVLEKILRTFPRDPQVQRQYADYRARKALRLLDQKSARPPEKNLTDLQPTEDPETEALLENILKSMLEAWRKNGEDPQLGFDFAVAHWMWDNLEGALAFLPPDSGDTSALWLRAELLLRTRRYVQLLGELLELEKRGAQDPDITFAVSYLRAQAYWGLGRKFNAIEILEGIVTVKPSYRSAAALLSVWRNPTV